MPPAISIIIPAFNEEKGIHEVVTACLAASEKGDEIIVVDDGSRDATSAAVQPLISERVRLVRHPSNLGKAAALHTGFSAATHAWIATIDGDGTYDAHAFREMRALIPENDMVVGTRFRGKKAQIPVHRLMANKAGAAVVSALLGRRVTDVTSGMRIMNREKFNQLRIHAKGLDFEAELTSRAARENWKCAEVEITPTHRKGQSSLRFFRDMGRFFVAAVRGKYF